MLGVGEGAAVQVVNQCTGALVAALVAAEDGANLSVGVSVDSVDSSPEVSNGVPGVGLGVQVLHSTGSLEDGLVDGHAVSSHDQGVLVGLAVSGNAGSVSSGVQLSDVGVVDQVGHVDHQTLGAPVSDQTLGAFHDQVGSSAALDGGVDLVVTIGVVQVLDGNLDALVGSLKGSDHGIDVLLNAPVADGVGPQSDLGGGCSRLVALVSRLGGLSLADGASAQAQDHDQSQQHSDKLLHNVPPHFLELFWETHSISLYHDT